MLFIDEVHGLVLGNLNTCTDIALSMQKEGEGTGKVFAAKDQKIVIVYIKVYRFV